MNSINKVILIGTVGADPILRYTTTNLAVVSFSLATNEFRKLENGEKQQNTEWHKILFYGQKSDIIKQYVKKGSKLYIEGKIHYCNYKDKSGVERKAVQINGKDFVFLDTKEKSDNTNSQDIYVAPRNPRPKPIQPTQEELFNNMHDDDLPF